MRAGPGPKTGGSRPGRVEEPAGLGSGRVPGRAQTASASTSTSDSASISAPDQPGPAPVPFRRA